MRPEALARATQGGIKISPQKTRADLISRQVDNKTLSRTQRKQRRYSDEPQWKQWRFLRPWEKNIKYLRMTCYLGMDWWCLVKCMLDSYRRMVWFFIIIDFCSGLGDFGCLRTLLREARFPSEMNSSQNCVPQNKEVVGLSVGAGAFSFWPCTTSNTVTCKPRASILVMWPKEQRLFTLQSS